VLRKANGIPYNIKHVGGTVIGENVWIGDNVTVCNSIFEGAVQVGDNCKIDNHTQIAHNCILGNGNVVTAGVIMLGSSELQNNCWLAPGSLVMNRIVVEDNGFVGANSMANNIVKKGTTVFGTPAVPINEFAKIQFQLKKIIKQNTNK
jgi:UDP-3-O-[3-hydroxymyristoyl] glucosamine N-acyltransferase